MTRLTSLDINKLTPYAVGFDRVFDNMARYMEHQSQSTGYPPYNIVKDGNNFQIEIALAGFKKEEVFVYTEHGKLFVEGQKEDKETDVNYSHKGIAQRSFTRSWTLTEDWRVDGVESEDGLLSVTLQKVVPEHFQRQDFL